MSLTKNSIFPLLHSFIKHLLSGILSSVKNTAFQRMHSIVVGNIVNIFFFRIFDIIIKDSRPESLLGISLLWSPLSSWDMSGVFTVEKACETLGSRECWWEFPSAFAECSIHRERKWPNPPILKSPVRHEAKFLPLYPHFLCFMFKWMEN